MRAMRASREVMAASEDEDGEEDDEMVALAAVLRPARTRSRSRSTCRWEALKFLRLSSNGRRRRGWSYDVLA